MWVPLLVRCLVFNYFGRYVGLVFILLLLSTGVTMFCGITVLWVDFWCFLNVGLLFACLCIGVSWSRLIPVCG